MHFNETELEARVELLEQLLHDYKVFCNLEFYAVGNIAGDDFLNAWKEDRDNLKERANHLLGE